MARAESSFTVSAQATRPAARPSTATYMGVFPAAARPSAVDWTAAVSIPRARSSLALPSSTARPWTVAST